MDGAEVVSAEALTLLDALGLPAVWVASGGLVCGVNAAALGSLWAGEGATLAEALRIGPGGLPDAGQADLRWLEEPGGRRRWVQVRVAPTPGGVVVVLQRVVGGDTLSADGLRVAAALLHDLRTPLSSCQLMVQGLLGRQGTDEAGYLVRLERELGRMGTLSALLRGLAPPELWPVVDLSAALEAELEGHRRSLDRRGIRLGWAPRPGVRVWAEPARLGAALGHVLRIVAERWEGGPLEVRVWAEGASAGALVPMGGLVGAQVERALTGPMATLAELPWPEEGLGAARLQARAGGGVLERVEADLRLRFERA